MKNLVELITSNEWNALTKEQRIAELQGQIDEIKNETEYPVFCYSKECTDIVKFDGLTSGEVVKQGYDNVGKTRKNFKPKDDTKQWKPLPYNKERRLYHTQLVWCFQKDDTHRRFLGFYDAINDKSFSYEGKLNGYGWNNYEPYEGEWSEWAIEAHKTLEGLND